MVVADPKKSLVVVVVVLLGNPTGLSWPNNRDSEIFLQLLQKLVTIILVRSPSNFIFTQFGYLLTAPKRKKLKIPNFIFLTK